MEAVADFAYPLPIYVTLAILGVRQSDRDRLKAACELFLQLSTDPRPTFAKALESQRGLLEIKEQFASLLEERRRHPGHDFISNLAAGEKEGVLSESEILTTLVTVLIGGHETTTYLLASSLWVLKQYPEQLEALKRNPALLPAATEEFIRYVGPFQYVRRVATRQIDFRGKKINAGDLVMLHLAAGNRDPAVFSAPEKLDITRSPNRTLDSAMVHMPAWEPPSPAAKCRSRWNRFSDTSRTTRLMLRKSHFLIIVCADPRACR
jgi:cytochrome P450